MSPLLSLIRGIEIAVYLNKQEEMVNREIEFLRELSENEFLEVMLGESLYSSCCKIANGVFVLWCIDALYVMCRYV